MPLLAVGCGDSLFSGDRLDDLFGIVPIPERVGWELRWLSADGLVADCATVPADVLDDSDAAFGELLATPPEDVTPEVWLEEGGSARWALGLPVLVDRDAYAPDDDGPYSLDPHTGIYGVAYGQALLFAEGNPDVLDEWLIDGAHRVVEAERSWVELLVPVVVATGAIDGALLEAEPESAGLWVTQVEHLDHEATLWTGEALGGLAYAEGCR